MTPTVRSQLQRFEGLLASRAGDAEAGARYRADAVATVRPVGRPFPLAKVLLEQGELLAATGDSEGAEEALREAQRIFAELRAEPWSARADHALAALAEPARVSVSARRDGRRGSVSQAVPEVWEPAPSAAVPARPNRPRDSVASTSRRRPVSTS